MITMKNSNIEWIGEIPSDLEVLLVKDGVTQKKANEHQEDPVVLTLARSGVKIRDMSNAEGQFASSYYDYNPVTIDDMLINPMDLISGDNCSLSKVEGVISPAYVNLRYREGFYPAYYQYYFKYQYWCMAFFAHGKGVSFENRWTLNNETLMKFPLIVPPLEIQKSIAKFLDQKCSEIDSLSADIQSQIDILDTYKKSVIFTAISKGLNPNVKMKESGVDWVGSIPEHWRFEKGKYHFTNNKFIPGVNSGKYQRLSLTLNGVLPRSKDDADGLQPKDINTYQLLKKGELVFKLIDLQNVSTSRIGLAHDTGLVSPAYIVLHAKEDILPEYIQYFYLMMWHREIFNALGDNGVRSSLSASDLLNIRIPIPPLNVQQEIANYLDTKCDEIDAVITDKKTQLKTLAEYKKSLIYEYVTGKKEVL